MMNYLYYPGCSLEGTAKEYNQSTRAMMEALDVKLTELTDWTCCGATAAEATSELLSLALPAVNLAIAESMDTGNDVMVPCSACYLNLKKVEKKTATDPELLARINTILNEKSLRLNGGVRIRHLLDVMSCDLKPERIQSAVKRSLEGVTIAPYYGCQCLRPYVEFDDPEDPHSMDALIKATGARPFPWKMGAKCCGASHMNTKMEVAIELTGNILKSAREADAIVTVCPMCQMNLEGYQGKISDTFGMDLNIPIIYLPQLIGIALGIPDKQLQLDLNLSPIDKFLRKIK